MTSTVTSKGQITLPAEVRERLRLRPGDKLDFRVRDDGVVEMLPRKGSLQDLFGILPRPAQPATLEEMQRAIEGASET